MVKKILVIGSFLLYIVACVTFAFKGVITPEDNLRGILCLALGWFSFTSGFPAFIAWLANFPYLISVVMVFITKKTSMRFVAVILSILSLLLSFGAFGVTEIMKDEGGTMVPVTFGPGLFLWLLAIVSVLIASVMPAEKKKVKIDYIHNPNPTV